jgi:pyruvate dehydrogenase phosphatase regulatory subunit
MKWLKSHMPEDGSVFVSDVTSLYTALNVIGPKAKYLLAELSDENFNDFARMTCRVSVKNSNSFEILFLYISRKLMLDLLVIFMQ